MTEPAGWPADDPTVGGTIEDFEDRLEKFREGAALISPPIGTLLQTIALAQQQYADAAERHGTTIGEAARLIGIVEQAMAVTSWLRGSS